MFCRLVLTINRVSARGTTQSHPVFRYFKKKILLFRKRSKQLAEFFIFRPLHSSTNLSNKSNLLCVSYFRFSLSYSHRLPVIDAH
jgi:hypothetical protein